MKKAFETSLEVLENTSETISIIVPGREVLLGDIYHKIAVSYYYQKQEYPAALEYAEKSYEIFSRIPDHYAMAWIVRPYMARERIYSMMGERDTAIADAEASIRISKEYYGEYHAQVNRRYMYLAEVYRNLGMKQEELETSPGGSGEEKRRGNGIL